MFPPRMQSEVLMILSDRRFALSSVGPFVRTNRFPRLRAAGMVLAAIAPLAFAACTERSGTSATAAPSVTLPEGRDGKLMKEAADGDIFSVDQLLSDGADANARASNGTTALMGAAYGGYPRTTELLIARGAKIDARSNDGATALHYAASGGDVTVVGILLKAGADPNAKSVDGATPLMWAERREQESVIAVLRGSQSGG
jgi:Ankyrin repeats (3 copies)